jgi:hypothetical protein
MLAAVIGPFACGGGAGAPKTDGTPKPEPSESAAPSAAPSVVASASSAPKPDDDYDDPNESGAPIAMTVVFDAKAKFPKASVKEAECWRSVNLVGAHEKDFAALVEKCGQPSGALEYAKPVHGKLHHKKDQRDTFTLKLKGGFCYRYFAVADDSIKDLDIFVTSKGSIVADDKTVSPVAIVEASKSWCQTDDVDYEFRIEVDGEGKGGYTFGVWARPK